jgi:signal transduction histidine kinase
MAFVDIRMPPGWDGIETIGHLWREDPHLEVVICSAYSDYTWETITEKLGVSDHLLILKKPFDNIEVRQLAATLTEKWNLSRQTERQLTALESAVEERSRALRQQHEQLERTHTQLLHAQKMESIGQLAAGIAHEINTPTQFIGDNARFLQDAFRDLRGLLDVYERLAAAARAGAVTPALLAEVDAVQGEADVAYLAEEIPEAIAQSLDGVERVTHIVRAMKDFSHPGVGGKEAVDLNKAIESTVTVARNEWKYVAQLVTEFDPTLPAVPCLACEFNQVILNMVINAAHAIESKLGKNSSERGTITITTREVGRWVEILIRDTGTGIPKENFSRIFDHFFTTKEVGKGTGQGLAIAHAVITEKHGGTIDVESELGTGTTFTIRLPLDPEVASREEATQDEEAYSLR